jgi:hypothetical protein
VLLKRNDTMTRHALLLATLALCALAAPAMAQPTIMNGDFETDAAMFSTWPGYYGFYTPPASTGFPAGTNPMDISGGWTHTGGGGIVPGGQPGNPDGTFRDNGANMTNVAFIQGAGSLTQSVSGFTTGTNYQLDFDYNARACCPVGSPATPMMTVSVSVGDPANGDHAWIYQDSDVQPVDPNGTHTTPWYHARFTFRADSDTLNVKIAGQPASGGDATLIFDNFVLSVAQ